MAPPTTARPFAASPEWPEEGAAEMPIFDEELQRLVLRLVYDGPPGAGKTTNLSSVCELFGQTRRGEMNSPAVGEDGRTRYFDWLDFDAGVVGGYRLRCQLLSVPGQRKWQSRRKHILDSADAVVFVFRGNEEGLAEALPYLRETQGSLAVPIVLQANHLDADGALSLEDLHHRIAEEFPEETPKLFGAEAINTRGVKETLGQAIRLAARRAERELIDKGIESIRAQAQKPAALLDAMYSLDLPLGAVVEADPKSSPPSEPVSPFEEQAPAPETPKATDALSDLPERSSLAPAVKSRGDTNNAGVAMAATRNRNSSIPPYSRGSTVPPKNAAEDPTAEAQTNKTLPPAPFHVPALHYPPPPRPDEHNQFVWPAWQGREILRQLADAPTRLHRDLVGDAKTGHGSDVLLEAGGWRLSTQRALCYPTPDAARDALLGLAQRLVHLGPLMPQNMALAVSEATDDEHWVWMLSPWVPTMQHAMQEAVRREDEMALGDLLIAFTRAAFDAVLLGYEERITLTISPEHFSWESGASYYLHCDVAAGTAPPGLAEALLGALELYRNFSEAGVRYVLSIERALRRVVDKHPGRRRELLEAFEEVRLSDPHCEGMRKDLLARLQG